MSDLALGLDVGTQSTKALLVDAASAHVVAAASAPHADIGGLGRGASEQHPSTWLDAIRATTSRLWKTPGVDAGSLVAVGVSGQQHGLVLVDSDGDVVRPAKLWNDTTCAAEAEVLTVELGRKIPAGYTAGKVRWVQHHEPDNWARTTRLFLPHDYVNWKLTGSAWMEAGDASGTGFFDAQTRTWDPVALAALDDTRGGRARALETLLPDLVAPGSVPARISSAGADLCAIPEGVPVSTGSGDNMMSAVGAGATRSGRVVVSLGTSGTVFSFSREPVPDSTGTIAPFCDATGAWLPLLCTMNATGIPDEIVHAFPGETHDRLAARARDVAPGCDGLTLVPYFVGERVPDLPHATGALTGIRPGRMRAPYLYRAALEGTTAALAVGVARMRELGVAVDAITLVGGGARNSLWRQIVADVFQVPVTKPAQSESAAFGAAIHAIWSVRRENEPDLAAADVADDYVSTLGGPTLPDAETADCYSEVVARLHDATQRLFFENDA